MKNNVLRLLLSVFVIAASLFILVASILLTEVLPTDGAIALIVLAIIVFVSGFCVAIGLEYSQGCYECKKCGHKFTPTLKAYVFSAHSLTARYLKCPECGKTSWCKGTNYKGGKIE